MSKYNELKRLAEAATPQDFDSAEEKTENGYIECPNCGGEGEVELEADYCNYDNVAIGVQFYGIGNEFGAAESYYRAANPASVIELISELERLDADNRSKNGSLAAYGKRIASLQRAVKNRYKVIRFYGANDITGELCVLASDFDAEHAMRLSAERQVGELREQLAQRDLDVGTLKLQNRGLVEKRDLARAKLDTAMGLLREGNENIAKVANELLQCSQGDGLVAANERTAIAYAALKAGHRVNAFLNTTSTEGKDHE